MAGMIKNIQATGMKAAIWYSVPFCGKKSKAFQQFEGKFLTEEHRWAPVFDPRYPEVRAHLIGLYTRALKDWNLDGFKLDFIDDFHIYESTPLGAENGRDYGSINEAVDRLLTDVITELRAIKSDVFIEFRQKYTGPAMRKYGNMFRAFDCPGDAVMNRIRIADIRMLCGNTAVHADMITWHKDETVEVAALQLINILFGVPQLSIMLQNAPASHVEMVRFYTKYWNDNAEILMNGYFVPSKPLANYPTQRVSKEGHTIIGVYEELVTTLENADSHIHFHNGQIADQIVIRNTKDLGMYTCQVYDCRGNVVANSKVQFNKGLMEIAIPPCGILTAEKV
jgi:alpha-galactosidase